MSGLTLIVGDEEFLVSEAVHAAIGAAVAAGAELIDLDAAETDPMSIEVAVTPSLFGGERILVLRGIQNAGKELAAFLPKLAAQSDNPVVMTHAGGAKGKALLAELTGRAKSIVECSAMTKASERRTLLARRAREADRKVEGPALEALMDAVGTDLRELATALDQLISDTTGPITVEVVGRYHRGRAEATGFAIADAVCDGDAAAAMELTRTALLTGQPTVLVVSALASNLRLIARVAGERGSSFQIAKAVGAPAWKVEKAQRWARRWRPGMVSAALQLLAETDIDVKGGGADPAYSIEHAVMRIVHYLPA